MQNLMTDSWNLECGTARVASVGMEERLCELKLSEGGVCHAYAKDSARLGGRVEDDCEVIQATAPQPVS